MNERIVILGGGESGVGAAMLARQKGYEVFLSDGGNLASDRRRTLKSQKIDFEEGGHSEELLLNASLVVKSPGIPDSAPLVQKLVGNNIPVISEIEFAYRFIDKAKVIAITGTNGKTTTSLLAHHLLKTAGYKVALGGNVGRSLARLVAEGGYHYYVVEVSSFQLDGIDNFRPDVAVLLNITPDHLDRYEYNFDKYVTSKFRIIENLTNEQVFIYCADSAPVTEEISRRKIEASMFAMSASNNNKLSAYLKDEHLIFNFQYKHDAAEFQIPVSEISLIGKHNMVNSMAAVLSALCMEVPMEMVLKGLKNFKNAPHRLEFVKEIDGAAYINDSKATNVDSVYYALDGVKGDIIWIAGGIDKGNDYTQIEKLVKKKVKGLICMGKDNRALTSYFGSKLNKIAEVDSVKKAIDQAHEWAEEGDVVLLSPACASFDLFSNYEDRGDKFKRAVNKLAKTLKAKEA
ncbi:UDP-N-acetylmuramoylalanine--D-glutamate ligase [Ekhidna lutea]|uniref:UDP-N-acetylmuramoylalanine--D-glutamate ligase n=1 Tax=Ekhidna lutea TaxID=447679 RepID=A0A239L2C0_EKHLU|nr:UDP-N-acetylmuramoyl-L-alanine--D-glutamate ligase [Ekhidna lutea]SNT24112.1 UDP-N-acetylmuramoylalanine--D-glutamate ligase [Ekhidna lutea]